MPKFGRTSRERRDQCHPDLIILLDAVIEEIDIAILCGHRDEVDQMSAHATGKSKAKWPQSKHNKRPAMAVDIAPYPVDWDDEARWLEMGALVLQKAIQLNIPVRWGGLWNSFKKKGSRVGDGPHFELIDRK